VRRVYGDGLPGGRGRGEDFQPRLAWEAEKESEGSVVGVCACQDSFGVFFAICGGRWWGGRTGGGCGWVVQEPEDGPRCSFALVVSGGEVVFFGNLEGLAEQG
jgi:hypothetical protein